MRQAEPLRISLAGYGVVGQALAERLRGEPRFEIDQVLVRDAGRERAVSPPVPLTSDPQAFLGRASDIVVDALSCERTGSLLCHAVLPKGISVVSASKRLISAEHGSLTEAARRGGGRLLYSAAVGGSAAVLETVDRARAAGTITEVAGVLNGTVNFVLQRLSEGIGLTEGLLEARSRGFAEEDATADLSGADAAAKLRLIARRAMDLPVNLAVETESLDAPAARRIAATGERWVQVARLRRVPGGVKAAVSLQPLRQAPELPVAPNEWNCAVVRLADGRTYRCVGRGAGGAATAESIVADLYEVLRARSEPRLDVA